jgi:DNA-binding NarL/FixJ family response regulator
MNRDAFVRFRKIMLVSSTPSQEVERCLRNAAGEIVKVSDGEDAIERVQHANFDIAVLVSTGKKMDVAETFFNLRDIKGSMPILIVDDRSDPHCFPLFQAAVIAHASSNTQALRVEELAGYLGLEPGLASPGIARRRRHKAGHNPSR